MKKIGEILKKLDYPGRGIVLGLSPDGNNFCIAYFIMGRSENSKNRIFRFIKNGLQTVPLKNEVRNKNLMIYEPVLKFKDFIIVGNGNQTKTILEGLKKGLDFNKTFSLRNFENDPPIYTPRIAAVVKLKKMCVDYRMAIIKKSPVSHATERFFFEYDKIEKGYGHFIHTYKGQNDDDTQSFNKVPYLIEMFNNHVDFQMSIWKSLNEKNRISLFTEFINLNTKKCFRKIINKN